MEKDANEITLEDISMFLSGDGAVTSAADEEEEQDEVVKDATTTTVVDEKSKTAETQAFAHRLKQETNKVRNDEREKIARSMGYDTYDNMIKANEKRVIEAKGLNAEEVAPVIDELVEKRIKDDPRLKELEILKQERVKNFAQEELAKLKELTGGKITKIEDVPKDVIELWKTKGSLKGAYLELYGEALIKEARIASGKVQNSTSTSHMASAAGNSSIVNPNKRPFTAQEKEIYKLFNPNVSDEELSKMQKDK